MALKHARPGDMIDLTTLTKDKSIALVKHTRFEVMRVSLSVVFGYTLREVQCMPLKL